MANTSNHVGNDTLENGVIEHPHLFTSITIDLVLPDIVMGRVWYVCRRTQLVRLIRGDVRPGRRGRRRKMSLMIRPCNRSDSGVM